MAVNVIGRKVCFRLSTVGYAMGLVFLFLPAAAWSDGHDTQLWNEIYTTTGLTRHIDFVANGDMRIGRDVSATVQRGLQVGLNFHAGEHFKLSPTYRYISENPTGHKREYESRASLLAMFHFPFPQVRMWIGHDLEYRFRNSRTITWRSRPRLTLERAIGPECLGLSGYLSEEGFYDSTYNDWVRIRNSVGFKKKLARTCILDLHYCRQIDSKSTPGDLDVIGIALRWHFGAGLPESKPAHQVD